MMEQEVGHIGGHRLTREELFGLVWSKPTQQVAKDLGISDTAVAKLCRRLQVPKPPRGYWARAGAGKTPRRPPLVAFREDIDHRRRKRQAIRAGARPTKLQREFLDLAIEELRLRGRDVPDPGKHLETLDPLIAARLLLIIQNRAIAWLNDPRISARSGVAAEQSVRSLVGKLVPLARPQLIVFEEDDSTGSYRNRMAAFVLMTTRLIERVAALAAVVRDQGLHHVAVPLDAADHAWRVRYLVEPDEVGRAESRLCISINEVWIETFRRSWRGADHPPDRIVSAPLPLRAVVPIDLLPIREIGIPETIGSGRLRPFAERLKALQDMEQVCEMLSETLYRSDRSALDDRLSLAEQLWFGGSDTLASVHAAIAGMEDEHERWEREIDAEGRSLARHILGVVPGDIVTGERQGRIVRIEVRDVSFYAYDDAVIFEICGPRFRKDGSPGKLEDRLSFRVGHDRNVGSAAHFGR